MGAKNNTKSQNTTLRSPPLRIPPHSIVTPPPGLGKEQQGMSSALIVEKTGRSRGVIVNESDERTKARVQLAKDEEAREQAAKKVEDGKIRIVTINMKVVKLYREWA